MEAASEWTPSGRPTSHCSPDLEHRTHSELEAGVSIWDNSICSRIDRELLHRCGRVRILPPRRKAGKIGYPGGFYIGVVAAMLLFERLLGFGSSQATVIEGDSEFHCGDSLYTFVDL